MTAAARGAPTAATSDGSATAGEEQTRREPLRALAQLLRPDRRNLVAAVLFFIVKASPAWLLPFFTARIIDIVVSHGALRELWLNAALLVVAVAQNLPTNMVYIRLQSKVIRNGERRLRSSLTERIQELSMGFHASARASTLQTKVVRDVENVEQMLRQVFDLGLSALTTMVGSIVLTAIQAPALLPELVVLVAIAGFTVAVLRRRLNSRNQEFRLEVEQMSAKVAEMTAMVPLTRAHGLEQREMDRIGQSIDKVRTAGLGLDAANGFLSAAAWITYNLFQAFCLVGAAWLAYTQVLPVTPGDVILVSSYMVTLTASVVGLTTLAPILTRGLESMSSIGEVLQTQDLERNEGRRGVDSVSGTIRFDHVGLRYPRSSAWAVDDLSFEVEPGTTLALVGPSGSGKSSVLNLAIGFLRPTRGRVLLDGTDMEELDLRTYRQFVSVVSQHTVLLDGSVRENVSFGLGDVDDRRVRDALEEAQAWEFVSQLEHGLDTNVGPNGAMLSGGQRQRIAIARALIRDPRVLLLDEATSALDPVSEAQIQRAMERLVEGRTTFIVAHRLSTVRDADRILVLESGRIVESGTHADLLSAGGAFARMQSAGRAVQ